MGWWDGGVVGWCVPWLGRVAVGFYVPSAVSCKCLAGVYDLFGLVKKLFAICSEYCEYVKTDCSDGVPVPTVLG